MEADAFVRGFEESRFPPCSWDLCAFEALVDLFLEMP
jgi:hypothetical protein